MNEIIAKDASGALQKIYTPPAGEIMLFAGDAVPDGWLPCNGALVNRSAYPELFEAIGTIYGTGDGSTTFALPDTQDLWPAFSGGSKQVGVNLEAGLPDLQGRFTFADLGTPISVFLNMQGVFPSTTYASPSQQQLSNTLKVTTPSGNRSEYVQFKASSYNATYGKSATVQPKSLVFLGCIKY